MLLCSASTVDRVRKRFAEEGISGLIDQRGDNGQAKVNEDYILALIKAVERTRWIMGIADRPGHRSY
jgi:hypothetical protein